MLFLCISRELIFVLEISERDLFLGDSQQVEYNFEL